MLQPLAVESVAHGNAFCVLYSSTWTVGRPAYFAESAATAFVVEFEPSFNLYFFISPLIAVRNLLVLSFAAANFIPVLVVSLAFTILDGKPHATH